MPLRHYAYGIRHYYAAALLTLPPWRFAVFHMPLMMLFVTLLSPMLFADASPHDMLCAAFLLRVSSRYECSRHTLQRYADAMMLPRLFC